MSVSHRRRPGNHYRIIYVLGIMLLAALQACAMGRHKKTRSKAVEYSMTVAAIRPTGNDQAFTKVSFNESQRFYRLPKDADPAFLQLLTASERDKTPVLIKRADETSDVILDVRRR